jgi:hypothetical protein
MAVRLMMVAALAAALVAPISALALGGRALSRARASSTACRAGFGKAAPEGAAAKKGRAPLNAKKQWDRYADLAKKDGMLAEVAVRKDDASEWKAVGRVNGAAGCTPVAAAARQRVLIGEHGKRVHLSLMQLGSKAAVQVGVRPEEGADFTLVSKADDDAALVDTDVGFEGTPDKLSGYYCHYVDGRIAQFGTATAVGSEGAQI